MVVTLSDGAMGAAVVFLATYIAPTHKKHVASTVTVFAVLAAIVGVGKCAIAEDYWGAYTYFWFGIGALACGVTMIQLASRKEIKVSKI